MCKVLLVSSDECLIPMLKRCQSTRRVRRKSLEDLNKPLRRAEESEQAHLNNMFHFLGREAAMLLGLFVER